MASSVGKMLTKARDTYMQHTSKLTRVSLNVRVGVLSGTRCCMDWEMGSHGDKYDAPLQETEGFRGKLKSWGKISCGWEKSYAFGKLGENEQAGTGGVKGAWKRMLGRYMGNVNVWGRYHNIPGAVSKEDGAQDWQYCLEHNNLVWKEWKGACEEFQEAIENQVTRKRKNDGQTASAGTKRGRGGS